MNEWKDKKLYEGYTDDANVEVEAPATQTSETPAELTHTNGKINYTTTPAWTAPYEEERKSAMRRIESQQPFTYDPATDPAYQQYKDTYTRMGEKARDDTIGVLRSRGGGQVSSYAAIAAQQANEAYMQELADKVPELRQMAYDMWLREGDRARSDLQMYDALNSADAARWSTTELDPYLQDRSYAFDREKYQDSREDVDWEKQFRERAYQDDRDDTMWSRGYQERAYQDSRDDELWSRDYQERAYQDGRDDALWSRGYQERAYQDTRSDTAQGQGTTSTPSGGVVPSKEPWTPVQKDEVDGKGASYNMIWSRARTMFDQGKTEQEIADYLNRFSEHQLTEEGLKQILKSLNLGGYRTNGGN